MNYTLYIDESGDFISERGQWLISGVLLADTYENCEKFLNEKMLDFPQELGLKSIKQFHLTEFRRYGNEKAVDMAKTVLDKLNNLPFDYHCLATINYSKSSLSDREKTYRLMLADLLALCEIVISEDDVMENLDLVVATRTIDGVLATSISNINEEIIKSLPFALEVDLATKGMVELIGKHIKIKMDYANNSWGLVCADFIANLNYHNRKQHEKKYLTNLSKQGKFSSFESFGGYEIRRANIAERDQDYILALYRWITIYSKKSNTEQSQKAMERLFDKVFNNRGTSGQNATFEALIERLWRNNNNIDEYTNLSLMLSFFDEELEKYLIANDLMKYKNILFRVRNMILLVENHRGDIDRAKLVLKKQNDMIGSLASNPENFQMILDFKIHEIELLINSLKLDDALIEANKYYVMIENYKEVWKLLIETEKLNDFENSRASIKAKMTLIRCEIISNKKPLLLKEEDFRDLEKVLSNSLDISRLNNYKIMFLLKQEQPQKAIKFCLSTYEDILSKSLSYFDLLWFLHSVNDLLLDNENINIKEWQNSINFQIGLLDPNKKGHPMDIIWREVALYKFLTGDKSSALKAIKKSKNSFDLGDSPIAEWLNKLIDIHQDYINGNIYDIKYYFDANVYIELFENKTTTTDSILKRVRQVSPY